MGVWSEEDALEFIRSRARFGIRPGLERTERLLRLLGNPEKGLRFVHIAGTNGKGSTASFMHGMLKSAGYRAGLYTSPSLHRFSERIAIGGEPIGAKALARLTAKIRDALEASPAPDGLEPTEFEVATVLAYLHFAESRVDLVVLEAGLGGRYDATNTVVPEVSVITNVGLDHAEILGPTVERIARDKAGIAKRGRPLVTAAEGSALAVVESEARSAGSPLYVFGRDFWSVPRRADESLQEFDYYGLGLDLGGLRLRMLGRHQTVNASLALCACELLARSGFLTRELTLRQGLLGAAWPGRLETLSRLPLVVLDGAHNEPAALALAEALVAFGRRSWIFVLGVLADKDVEGIVEHLAPLACRVIATRPENPRAAEPGRILLALSAQAGRGRFSGEALPAATVREALRMAVSSASDECGVCVAGSLYTVAEARAAFGEDGGKAG